MRMEELIERFSHTREQQSKAIFSTLLIAGNRLQTIFDKDSRDVTLKQFMLLTLLRQSGGGLTLTRMGELLGCSRQNVKRLALALEQKGFAVIQKDGGDPRAASIHPTPQLEAYFEAAAPGHRERLGWLFDGYSDEELCELFRLLMKLYGGIEQFEAKAAAHKKKEETK